MRKIVIVSHAAIGDTVHVIPAIRALRQRFGSDAKFVYWGFIREHRDAKSHSTLSDHILMPLGLVDEVVVRRVSASSPYFWWRMYFALGTLRSLLNPTIDHVFFLLPDPHTSKRARFVRFLAKFSSRLSQPLLVPNATSAAEDIPFAWRLITGLNRMWLSEAHGVDPSLAVITPPANAMQEAQRWLATNRRQPDRPLLVICPGASNPANAWPVDSFVKLVLQLQEHTDFEIVLSGGRNDRSLSRHIARSCPGVLDATGALTILGSAALFCQSQLMVGLDTGTTHVASACGVPYVALYGQRSTERLFFPPVAKGIVLQHPVPCGGCGLARCDRLDHPCMTGISVDDVIAAVRDVGRLNATVDGPHQSRASGR